MKGKKIVYILLVMILIIVVCVTEYFIVKKKYEKTNEDGWYYIDENGKQVKYDGEYYTTNENGETVKVDGSGAHEALNYTHVILKYPNNNITIYTLSDGVVIHCREQKTYETEEEAKAAYENFSQSTYDNPKIDGLTVTYNGTGIGMTREMIDQYKDVAEIYEF